MNACILHRWKWWKPQRILGTAKKIYDSQVQFWGCWMYNSASRPFFFWSMADDPCGGVKDRDMVQELQTGGDDVEFRDWPQRQIQPKKNVCFLCVSHVFHVLYFLRPVLFLPVLGPLVQLPVPPPLTKLAIGYHKKWETYATAPRSTNYSSYFS